VATRVLSVFGTRPDTIKMAPIVLALEQDSRFESRVCVTAQHRQMLDQMLETFGITPNHDLDLMQANQELFDTASRVLLNIPKILREVRPDIVLVQGDTSTCFAAALAAFYEQIPIGHVEAGLRTWNLHAPFPEEANRTLVSRIATLHYAPTQCARNNLVAEGVDASRIEVTGNTVIDALLVIRDRVVSGDLQRWIDHFGRELVSRLSESSRRSILVTSHRRESFGEGFVNICSAIRDLARAHNDWDFVYPVHLNPKVRLPVHDILSREENVHLIPPQNYEPFVWLMDKADIILTDSGGIQEEAPSLGKPVLVMRHTTERPEAVDAGTVRLIGTSCDSIAHHVTELLTDSRAYSRMSAASNPFGDGTAARKIVEHLATRAALVAAV
jgi:UDP-N-acetylglucosamine 2-epimerase (non-hydrolysing)